MSKKDEVIAKYQNYVLDVPDFPNEGIIFKDIVPVFESPEFSRLVIEAMIEELRKANIEYDKIIAPESRGFLFGIPLALIDNKGCVLARKPGKLPRPGITVKYELEYGSAALQISEGAIKPGEKVLIVDDLLATGGSANALAKIVRRAGATVTGSIFFIELTPLKGKEILGNDFPVISIIPVEAY